jgi:putative hemolysin
MILEISIIFALIILNGIFSMSEIAVVSSRKSKLTLEADEGDANAKAALELANSPDKFLSTVQVGITLIGILTGVFGGAAISEKLSVYFVAIGFFPEYGETIALALVVIMITYFSLIIGELLPKRIGLANPEGIASVMARPLILLSKIGAPAVWLLSSSTNLLAKIFGIKSSDANFISEEEIREMMGQASNTGELEKNEREIVERVFFLGDADVGSLMTPRPGIIGLDINADYEVNKEIIMNSVHTNYIVYQDQIDNVIGILNLKKTLPLAFQSLKIDFKSLSTPALFIPETTNALKLLDRMKEFSTHFAVATDEYGSVTGVITTNDLFKALVGNLYTQDKAEEIVKRDDGSYLVDGMISLDEFFRFFEIDGTEEIDNQGLFTLGGLVLYIAQNIPSVSQKFKWKDLEFEIIDMDGARVDKLLVKKLSN